MVEKSLIIGGTSGSRPYGVLKVSEISVDVENNTSKIEISLILKRPSIIQSSATKSADIVVGGVSRSWSGSIGGVGDKTLISVIQTVPHNEDGSSYILLTANIRLDISWSGEWIGTISGSGLMSLTNIARRGIAYQTLNDKTETSVIINWSSDKEVDNIWYSTDNGSHWYGVNNADGTKGSYTITGLNANSTYPIKTRVRNKASGLTTDSDALYVTTYAYPHCNVAPNLTIGEKLTLGFYNPLGRNITVNIIGEDGSQISNDQTSGTSITGYRGAVVKSLFYASIPSSKSGTYKVKVTYGNNVSIVTGGKYSVNISESSPTVGALSYLDTNSSTVSITGDNHKIIRNKSIVQVTATGVIGNKSATIASAVVEINGVHYGMTVSGQTATAGQILIDSATRVNAYVTVTDSRGISSTKTLSISMIDWVTPSAIISLNRQQNFYSESDIKVNAYVSSLDSHNTCTIQARTKKTGESSYGNFITLQNDVVATLNLDNSYSWDVQVIVSDIFDSRTYNLTLPIGRPIIFIDQLKNSIGINCFPKSSESLEINGKNIITSAAMVYLSSSITNLSINSYTIVPCNGSKIFGNGLSATNDGGIKIGHGITMIMVSGMITYENISGSGFRYIDIVKNSHINVNILSSGYQNLTVNGVIIVPPTLANVAENDVIYLMYYTPIGSDRLNGSSYGSGTYLTVSTL